MINFGEYDLLAIDPGCDQSGYVRIRDGKILQSGVLPNTWMLAAVDGFMRGWEKNGLKARIPGRTLSVLTRYMRKHLIGDLTMTSAQLAESIRGRLLRVGRAYVLVERGKVYAPSKTSPELEDIMRAYPKMVVGCYVVGVEAAAIAEDLECIRGGA